MLPLIIGWSRIKHSEKAMAPHSSSLAWKIPWTDEPGRLQSMGSLRVGHDWTTSLSFSLSCIGEGNGNLLQCSCLENPRDRGSWWAAIYGVSQSQTRLKWLSRSSRIKHCSKDFMFCYTIHFQILQLEKLAYWELFLCVLVGSSGLEGSVDICLVYLGGNKEI